MWCASFHALNVSGIDYKQYSIRADGAGIEADKIRDMMRPLVTTKPEGPGLELLLYRTIIEDQGGKRWAEPAKQQGRQTNRQTELTSPYDESRITFSLNSLAVQWRYSAG